MPANPIVITIRGYCSKKNRKAPNANGKGLHIETKTRQMIERMEMQIPGEHRDKLLEHPDREWRFTYTNAGVDKDGIITTVLDILQRYRVIVNDNIAHLNGKTTIWPAERGEEDTVTVILHPNTGGVEEPAVPRYRDPRRTRKNAPLMPMMLRTTDGPPEDDLPDFEVESLWDD